MFRENNKIFLNDKCDNCPAEGKFAAFKGNHMITLCGHCAREHANDLIKHKYTIHPGNYEFNRKQNSDG